MTGDHRGPQKAWFWLAGVGSRAISAIPDWFFNCHYWQFRGPAILAIFCGPLPASFSQPPPPVFSYVYGKQTAYSIQQASHKLMTRLS